MGRPGTPVMPGSVVRIRSPNDRGTTAMTAWSLDKHGPVTVLAFSRLPDGVIDFAVLLELGDLLETCAADQTGGGSNDTLISDHPQSAPKSSATSRCYRRDDIPS